MGSIVYWEVEWRQAVAERDAARAEVEREREVVDLFIAYFNEHGWSHSLLLHQARALLVAREAERLTQELNRPLWGSTDGSVTPATPPDDLDDQGGADGSTLGGRT